MQTFQFPERGRFSKAIANKNIEIAELGLEQFASLWLAKSGFSPTSILLR